MVCKLGRKEANYSLWGAWSAVRVPAGLVALVRRANSQTTRHNLRLKSRSEPGVSLTSDPNHHTRTPCSAGGNVTLGPVPLLKDICNQVATE